MTNNQRAKKVSDLMLKFGYVVASRAIDERTYNLPELLDYWQDKDQRAMTGCSDA